MTSLDKYTMHYFRDEMEKQALLKPIGKGILKMVQSAGKGAFNATKAYGKASVDLAGGSFLKGIGVAGTGVYAGKKGLEAMSKNNTLLKTNIGGAMPRAGNLSLPQ